MKTNIDKIDSCKTAKKVVKSGQITDPDRLFNSLSVDICDKPMEIGIELGLPFKVLKNKLETGQLIMLEGSKKAMEMLQLWKDSVDEDECTYSALAAALEKHGFRGCARKYCYVSIGNHMHEYTILIIIVCST